MRKYYLILILITSWFFCNPSWGQNLRKHQKDQLPCEGMECLELADQLFSLNLHYQAIKYYKEVVDEIPDHEHSLERLSRAYQEADQYEKSLQCYEQLISVAPDKFPEAYYGAGLMAQALGNFSEATKYLTTYLEKVKKGQYQEHAQLQLKSIRALSNLSRSSSDISTERLNNTLGTLEYAATPAGEDQVFYVTVAAQVKRKVKDYSVISGKYDTIFVNRLMQAAIVNRGISAEEPLDIALPADDYHTGSASLSQDGNTLYFTLFSSLSADNFCHLYSCKKGKNGKWTDPEKLAESINVNGFAAKDPMLIQDPKQGDVLFFSSDKPGGKGGFDLYYALKDENGQFSKVHNLGEPVNTAFDEVSPFFDQKSKNLYFSSNGHMGFGHFDVYLMLFDFGQKKGHLYNMGYPVNSTANDYYFSILNAKTGFVTTNHRDKNQANGQLHLQKLTFKSSFTYNTLPENSFEVETFEQDDSESNIFNQSFAYKNIPASAIDVTPEDAADVNINGQLLAGDEMIAGIHLKLKNKDGQIVDSLLTDENGKFSFRNLPADEFFSLLIDANESSMSALITYQNNTGDTLKQFNSNQHKQYFRFKKLTEDTVDEALVQNEDVSMNGNVLREGEIVVGELIYLTDPNGIVLDTTQTNTEGKFSFRQLNENEQYLVKMLTDEQGMMVKITYEDGEKKVLSTFNSREDRQYFIFQNLPTKETIIAKTKNDDLTMYGEVLRDGEVIVGELIILANSKGYPLDSTVTDADGQFSFRQLEEDDQYLIKMLTDEQGMLVKLVFKNDNNQVVRTLNSKEDRRYFIFQYLPSDETIASKVKNEDTAIFGEVLRNGEIIVGELIILTDTEGTPLDSTMTDANGKFTFRQLAGDENYLVKLLTDENGMLVKLEYQDEKGNVLKSLNSAEDQQYFAFNNLAQNQSHLAKMGNDDISISGEIISQAKEKQMVLLVDEQGNIVQSTTTDENGNFDFRNLPAGEEYTVWLDENDQGMTVVLNFKDKDNQVYRTLNSEQDKAFFEFKNLANFTSELSLIASTDDTKFKLVGNDKEQNFIQDLKQAMTYQYYESLEKKYGRQLLDEVNLRVQIGAYSKPQPDLFNYLKESEQVESESVNGLTKYLLGNFDILASAESLRQSAVDQGINDAFIAVYHAGKRVAILIY